MRGAGGVSDPFFVERPNGDIGTVFVSGAFLISAGLSGCGFGGSMRGAAGFAAAGFDLTAAGIGANRMFNTGAIAGTCACVAA